MRVIGFDAATDDTVVAATDAGEAVFDLVRGPGGDGRPAHSRELLAGIGEAAGALGGWERVDRIGVGLGPGTFTGLRIAVSTALGLSMSTGIPVVGVPTLEALARSLSDGRSASVPVLDAKRGEVFIAAWGPDGEALLPAAAVTPDRAAGAVVSLAGPVRVGGPGAVRFRDLFAEAGTRIVEPGSEQGRLSGIAICEIAAAAPVPDPNEPLRPIYIREPDARIWLERDAAPKAG